jgi:hypothetical protein
MKPLKTAEGWKLPLLQEHLKLNLPEWAAREDVVIAVSEASGLNIVCEDFVSHHGTRSSSSDFGADPTAASALKTMDRDNQGVWFIDEKKKLLVGWADEWRKHHKNLVPESLLKNIIARQKGQGAELDDLVPLTWLTDEQVGEWVAPVRQTRDCQVNVAYQALWQLYDSLKPKDKQLARSEKGFSLAMLDTVWLSDFIKGVRAGEEKDAIILCSSEDNHARQKDLATFTDPEMLSTLVMRVVKQPLDYWRVHEPGHGGKIHIYRPGPNETKKHTYTIELTGGKEDKPFHIIAKWIDPPFPVYDPIREAELRKTNQKPQDKQR